MNLRMTLSFAVLTALAGAPVRADEAKPREACRPDVERLCPGVQPGGGRIANCLRENAETLSELCKRAIETTRARRGGH